MKPLSYFRRSVVAFPLAALAALAMFVISELSYQDATHALDSLGDRGKARSQLNLLAKSLLDAETGQRGYLLTERQTYLAPYHKAITNIGGSLLWLDQYFGKNPDTAPVVSQLVSATDEKMSELSTTIELHDKGAAGAWRDLMLTDFGRERMVHVRTLIDQLLDYENKQVEIGRKGVYQTLMLNRIGVTAMAAISLLALFMYLRQTAALERATLDESRRVATERDRLEAEVTSRTVQLKELAQHLQTIREDERSHLARELHDELGALLTAAKLDVARLKSRLGDGLARSERAAAASQRDAQWRHRAQAPHHRGLAAIVAQQSRADRGAGDPAARVLRAQRVEGRRCARTGRAGAGGAADRVSTGAGGLDQHRQVRQGDDRPCDLGTPRRGAGARGGARRRCRLRHRCAADRHARAARHALPGGGGRWRNAPQVEARATERPSKRSCRRRSAVDAGTEPPLEPLHADAA